VRRGRRAAWSRPRRGGGRRCDRHLGETIPGESREGHDHPGNAFDPSEAVVTPSGEA